VTIDNFEIMNLKNEKLKCSMVAPTAKSDTKRPCVVYMHGNAGNKYEGQSHMNDLIPMGLDLFTFDFSGCGNSEGKWVTLGYKEKDDLHAVL
jgi:cephalosporin-C deacetylase-like acetyl esterase